MAGFAKLAIIGEHMGQSIVNILWYRSNQWVPGLGNPLEDGLAVCDNVWTAISGEYRACHPTTHTTRRLECTIYTDAFEIHTTSPVVRTIEEDGTRPSDQTSGSFVSSTLGFIMGPHVQISGVGHPSRTRGYLSVGPVPESDVDNYGHLSDAYRANVEALAAKLDDQLVSILEGCTFVPIRIHEKWGSIPLIGTRTITWRTYTDIIGYRVRAAATTRRSRLPEA